MAFSAPASPRELAEINITPLVDVMLVLLVIFMVTAPLLSRPIDAQLPQPVPDAQRVPPNDLVLKLGLPATTRWTTAPSRWPNCAFVWKTHASPIRRRSCRWRPPPAPITSNWSAHWHRRTPAASGTS